MAFGHAAISCKAFQQLFMASMVTQPMTLCCLLQHETNEEYKAALGIGGLNHAREDDATGTAFQSFDPDPATERRKKFAAESLGQGAGAATGAVAAADEARRRAAADEVMKQLLGAPLCLPSSDDLCVTLPCIHRRSPTACGQALCGHGSCLFNYGYCESGSLAGQEALNHNLVS